MPAQLPPRIAFLLLAAAAVAGLAGTDLVLPAVPALPAALGGTAAQAQGVLAAFVAGTALGLLAFGSLGARFDQRRLLALSLALYALVSAAAAQASDLTTLVALRFLQGAAGSAAAVFAPGFLRAAYGERAVGAVGLFGSIESLAPALAPIAGAALVAAGGWRLPFWTIAGTAAVLAAAAALLAPRLPTPETARQAGGYLRLAGDPVYLRYALNQALSLGGLLTFVFGAPAVLTGPLGGTIGDFILLQVTGIAFFILFANLAGRIAVRIGTERAILGGTLMMLGGMGAMLGYALAGGRDPLLLALLWVPVNAGIGLRGPPGFVRAVVAAHGDDARGAALVIVGILLATALGTLAAAPFVATGLTGLVAVAAAMIAASALALLLPRLAGAD
jgi:predicted MFS family arabinose efflux permease